MAEIVVETDSVVSLVAGDVVLVDGISVSVDAIAAVSTVVESGGGIQDNGNAPS